MKSWLKGLGIASLGLVVTTTAGVATLLYTSAGVDLALWGAKKALPDLHVESSEGALLNGFKLNNIKLALDGVNVQAKQLQLNLSSACLFDLKVCVEQLAASGVDVKVVTAPSAPDTEPSAPLTKISTPIPVYLRNLALNDIQLDIDGMKLGWKAFSTAATFEGSKLVLHPTLLQDIQFALAPATDSAAPAQQSDDADAPAAVKTALVLPEVLIPLDVVVEKIEVNNVTLDVGQEQKIAQVLLKAQAKDYQVKLEQLLVDAPQARLNLAGDVELKQNYPLNLKANADLNIDPVKDHQVNLTASGDLRQLALDVGIKPQGAKAGGVNLTLVGKADVLDPDIAFDVTAASPKLQWPLDSASADYTLTKTKIHAKGSLAGYQVSLHTSASGKEIPKVDLSSKLDGDLGAVNVSSLQLTTLGGSLHAKATASWKDQVKWTTEVNFKNIQPGLFWQQAEGKVSGYLTHRGHLTAQGGWVVEVPKLAVNGVVRGESLYLHGQLKASDNKGKGNILVDAKELVIKHGDNQIRASGKIDKKLALKLDINVPSLASSLPDAKGNIFGTVAVTGRLDAPTVDAKMRARNVSWQDIFTLESLDLNAKVDAGKKIAAAVLLEAKNIKASGVDLASVNLRVSGDEQQHSVLLRVKGEPVNTELALTGQFNRKTGWKGRFNHASIGSPVGEWKLDKTLTVDYLLPSNQVDLSAFCFVNQGSKLCLDRATRISDKGKASVSIRNFDLLQLKPFIPATTKVEGKVNAKVDVAWLPNALPQVVGSVNLSKGKVVESSLQSLPIGWNKVDVKLNLKDEKLQANALVDLTDNGTILLQANMTDVASDKRNITSSLEIKKITLDFLAPLLGQDAVLAGALNGNIKLTGDQFAPLINGGLVLDGLKVRSLAAPVEVTNGQIKLGFSGTKADLKGEIVTPDGTLNLKGLGNWQDLKAWFASLNVAGERLKVVVPPMVELAVSPDLTLKAKPDLIAVTGNVNVPWGKIIVESLPASAVQVSSDVVILNDDLKPVTKKEKSTMAITANIGVTLGKEVKLQAFGLSTLLEGVLEVQNDVKGPRVNGEINLKEGTYNSLGQDLLIKKGQILFNGAPEVPYLQIEAIRNPDAIEDSVEVGLRVTGPADAPEVTVFSNPAMPQANALSYLTRGRNLDSGSDGNAMTSMLIGLGLSQSGKLVGQIGEAFGVDDLTIDTAGSGNDEKVQVSGYILPGLQVKYGVGIFTSLPEFSVRYRLLQDLYIEAISGADNAVDVLYQFSIK